MHAEQGAKKEKKPLYAGELPGFNTFYIALAHNTAKISVSCITFGTLFAGTFSKQSYFDIEKEINEKGTDYFHTRTDFHRSASTTAACHT